MTNPVVLMLAAVLGAVAVETLIRLFTGLLTAWFAAGMRIKTRHERREFTGWRYVAAAVFVAGFVVADLLFRNTVIVIQCRARPGWELVTDYIEQLTADPAVHPSWRLAIAVDYRRIIEAHDPVHFGRPNRAVATLQRRFARLADADAPALGGAG